VTTLVRAGDVHFAWMLGEAPRPDATLRLPPDGVQSPDELRWLRGNLATTPSGSTWLIVSAGEVVGVCSLKGGWEADGYAEIGYGIAEDRRRRGHARAAVACLIEVVRGRAGLVGLTAQTAVANAASARVLETNGFIRTGTRTDPEDGDLLIWRLAL
jgi:RimJ/RimL family protein N-acetyltransferase